MLRIDEKDIIDIYICYDDKNLTIIAQTDEVWDESMDFDDTGDEGEMQIVQGIEYTIDENLNIRADEFYMSYNLTNYNYEFVTYAQEKEIIKCLKNIIEKKDQKSYDRICEIYDLIINERGTDKSAWLPYDEEDDEEW